ncbi:MAG: hypothetical protein A2Y41_13605 [Spirochaetes bacterium GWB1_36_13]|nr:MAG: hypothetical protein A2Y41_13605 [Spirochaetes bacterium GWB1_36_13]
MVTERSRSDTSTPLGVRVNLNNNRQPDYLTSDKRSESLIKILKSKVGLSFDFIDIIIPVGQVFQSLF